MPQCPVFHATDILGKKWMVALLQELSQHGTEGFNAMFRRLGKVSPKVVASHLKLLETAGIIEKRSHPEYAHKVQYLVTQKGMELMNVVHGLRVWNEKYHPEAANCTTSTCVECSFY